MFNCIDNCFVEFEDSMLDEYFFYQSEFFSQLKRIGSLGQMLWKVMGHIMKSWDNDPGPP